jgi:hypothetical protein
VKTFAQRSAQRIRRDRAGCAGRLASLERTTPDILSGLIHEYHNAA